MSMKVDESRQYIPEAWRMYTIEAGGEEILCNVNLEPQAGKTAPLCLIPTQARDVVVDPASLKVKPNVMSQWLDRLTAARASVLLVHGERYDDLVRLSNWARTGSRSWRRGSEPSSTTPWRMGTRAAEG